MNLRLKAAIIVIGIITFIVVAIFLIPRGLSLYYQIRGGQQIEYILGSRDGIDELECIQLHSSDEEGFVEVEKAIDNLNRALSLNKENSQAYYYGGKANCLLGELENAKKNYLQFTQLRPENPMGYIGLGFVSEELGDHELKINSWTSAGITSHEFSSVGDEQFIEERYDEAVAWHQRAIDLQPGLAESWLQLGESYEQVNEMGSALDAYRHAWEIDPEISSPNLIDAFMSVGDFKSIETTIQYLFDSFPNSDYRLSWYYKYGEALTLQEKYSQATSLYRSALEEFPGKPDLHISLGWSIFSSTGDYEAARDEIENAIELNIGDGKGYFSLARLLSVEGFFEEADEYFMRAIEYSPGNRTYLISRANNARSAGDLENAIEHYQILISQFPQYAAAYYQLAWAYHLNNQSDEAVKAIMKALELMQPNLDMYYARAGEIFRTAGRHEEAVQAYKDSLMVNPNNKIAQSGLAILEGE